MIKILFWNLNKKDLTSLIIELSQAKDIDLIMLAETENLNVNGIEQLKDKYDFIWGLDECLVLCLAKKNIVISQIQSFKRYILFNCKKDDFCFNLIGVHLESQMPQQNDSRAITITEMKNAIASAEGENHNNKTIVVGDFNLNPYDNQMTSYAYLHAVSFKDLIKKDFIKHDNKIYKKFYNPMLSLISEDSKIYGSYYYSDPQNIYWHFFDQCLLRKEMLSNFQSVEIVKNINDINLIKDNKPDINISDHLPIIVYLTEEEKHE